MTVEITVTETTVPKIKTGGGRPKKPNPFLDHVKVLAENLRTDTNEGKALTFEVPAVKGESEDETAKRIRTIVATWQRAGADLGITVRSLVDGRTITVWGVPRITRKGENAASAS